MTTAAPLSAVPDDPTAPPDAIPRITYSLATHTRYRGRVRLSTLQFTALAMLDGASMLNLAGGGADDEQVRAIKQMLVRVTVDDDGIGRDVEPRLLRDNQLSWAWLDDDTPDSDDDTEVEAAPAAIPDDARLKRLRKDDLVALAEQHQLATGGTNSDLIAGLAAARDYLADQQPSSDFATVDDQDDVEVVDAAVWRLVWPHDDDEPDDHPYEVVVDEQFTTREKALAWAGTHGSSQRRLAILLTDIDTFMPPTSLNDAISTIAAGAAGRPTGPSSGSRASRRGRARRHR